MKDCGVGGESHSGIGVLSVPAAPVVYMFAHEGSTNETPGLTPSATVRTANWLRHLPAPHRHVDDICSNSGEPLERQRQLTTPHHNQPVLPLRRLTRPLINNTRIDTPIATRPRTIISLARPPPIEWCHSRPVTTIRLYMWFTICPTTTTLHDSNQPAE